MKIPFRRHVVSTVGISIVQQFVGLGRHVLIAAYFGLSREFDAYLVIYAVASLVVFNLASVFDTVTVSRLVHIRENDGEAAFWRTSNRLLFQCLAGGAFFAGGLIAIMYVALPIVAAGFTVAEKRALLDLTYYFVPWIAIIIPYYAVSSHLKSLWQFHWVFGAEILVMVVSIFTLWCWHDTISSLPIAYATGYFCAFVALLLRRGILRSDSTVRPVILLGGMANQHLSNQIGVAAGVVDRYVQSYLAAGGISALGYVGQIVNNVSSLITFRDIYVVPLASGVNRSEKLERILKGVTLISVPCAAFLSVFSEPIIRVLFQRGQFTPEATILTGSLLQILACSLVLSSLLAPMVRLIQIMNRVSYSHLLYLVSLVGTAGFQYLFVFRLGLDVYGIAWAGIANSTVVTLVVAGLVRRCGVVVDWPSVLGTGLFAILVTAAAIAIAVPAAAHFVGLAALIVGGTSFSLFVAASYFAVRRRIQLIVG